MICKTPGAKLLIWMICSFFAGGAETAFAQTAEQHQVERLSSEKVGPFHPEHTPDLEKVRQLIFQKTNGFRESENREPLTRNRQLDETAQDFAEYMAKTDRYGHTADGSRPSERAKQHDYTYCLIAENIAYQFATQSFTTEDLAERTTQGWIHSPGHRRNMLRKSVTEIGLGIAQSESTGVFYAVQDFGRPRSAAISFVVSNETSQSVHYTVGKTQYPLPSRYRREHELCVSSELKLNETGKPNGESKQKAFHPQNGDHYQVIIENGRPVLTQK